MFFVTLLLETLLGWMAEQAGTTRLRALLVIEEARGLLPPHPLNPPSKAPLARLIAQARAFGVGVVLSTQHPVDLDYKALSNVGTWFLGGLRERDLQRDLASELRDRGVDEGLLAQLEKRTFLAVTPEWSPRTFGVRWALSYLRGPIAPGELPRLAGVMAPPPATAAGPPATAAGPPATAAQPPASGPTREAAPVASPGPGPGASVQARRAVADDRIAVNRRGALKLDPWPAGAASRPSSNKPFQLGSVPVVHAPGPEKNAMWRASLVGQVHATFGRPRLAQAFEADVALALPLTDDLTSVDWARAERVDPTRLRQGAPTGWHRFSEIPARAIDAALAFKPFQQARRDLEAFARQRLTWAMTGPISQANDRSASDGERREALRARLGTALSDLTGARTGSDLQAAALDWLLGPGHPINASASAATTDAARAWHPPADGARRLEVLIAALRRATGDAPAAPAVADGGGAEDDGEERLPALDVRVDLLGLLWTPAPA